MYTRGDSPRSMYRIPRPRSDLRGARVQPLELVPVPRHGAQIWARAPTKGFVQTWLKVWTQSLNGP